MRSLISVFARRTSLTVGVAFSALALTLTPPAAHAQLVVYNNDFSLNANGFSNTSRTTTPGTGSHPADTFLGEFSNNTVSLALTGLAAHTQTTLQFDFYAIRSLDGNGQFGGAADPFSVTATQTGGTTTLLNTNFANFPGNTQGFGGPNGSGGYLQTGSFAAQTGALEVNTLGYQFNGSPQDAVYRFVFTFADTSPNLTLNFTGQFNEGAANESFGLDNVKVTTNASVAGPEPGSIALALTGSGPLLLGLVRRRKTRRNLPK